MSMLSLMAALVLPSFAAESRKGKVGFWEWNARGGGFGGKFGSTTGYVFGQVCASSPDKLHHSDEMGHVGGYDDNGRYTICTCKYCGEQYRVYASDFQQSYDAQVSELPAPGYNSAGNLIWQPTASDVIPVSYCFPIAYTMGSSCSFDVIPYSNDSGNIKIDFLSTGNGLLIAQSNPQAKSNYAVAGFELKFSVPLSGSYCRIVSPRSLSNVVTSTGV